MSDCFSGVGGALGAPNIEPRKLDGRWLLPEIEVARSGIPAMGDVAVGVG